MKKLSFFLFLSILFFACKGRIEIAEIRDGQGNLIEQYAKNSKTNLREGISTKYVGNRKIEEAYYQNDLLHGERKLFHNNGKVQVIENYEKGVFIGVYKDFFENGILKSEGKYVAGAMMGKWKFYYSSGKLKEIVEFKDNEENGPFEEYHENGKIKARGTYLSEENSLNPNKEHGVLELFDETGKLIKKMNCNHGICVTTWTVESEKNN